MNVAYKHLEDPLRIGELTLAQWAGILAGVALAVLWGLYVSPFGWIATLFTSVYVAGLPALAAFVAGFTEFDLLALVANAWRWWRADARYLAGVREAPRGYVVAEPERRAEFEGVVGPDLEGLWRS